MIKIKKFSLIAVLALALVLGAGAGSAQAALTLGATTVASDAALTITGAAASDATIAGTTTSGTIAIGAVATGNVNIAAGNTAKTINLGTGTAIDTINIGTGATGVDVIRIGQAAADLALTDAQWSITSPGAATFTTVNGNTITTGTGTLTLGAGSTLATSATNSITLTSTAATNVTLPTTGTLATLTGTETLTNKTLTAPVLGVATGTSLATSAQNIFSAVAGTAPVVARSATATDDDLRLLPFTGGAAARFAGILTSADLTADKTWTFPNVTGTVVTSGDTGSVTSAMLAGSITAAKLVGTDFTAIDGAGALTIGATTATAMTIGRTGQTVTLPGNLTVTGTFSPTITTLPSLTLSSVTNQLVLGTTNTVTINSVAPAASRTYIIPDNATASVNFVLAPTSATATQAMFATATAGAPAFRAIADADVPDTITITTATNATNTAITNDAATAVAVYPTWVTANTGNLPQNTTSAALSFVPSTGILTATGFAGPLTGAVTGNASTATTLAADPADCGANAWATGIANTGALTCAAVSGGAGITDATVASADMTAGAKTHSVIIPVPDPGGAGFDIAAGYVLWTPSVAITITKVYTAAETIWVAGVPANDATVVVTNAAVGAVATLAVQSALTAGSNTDMGAITSASVVAGTNVTIAVTTAGTADAPRQNIQIEYTTTN